MGMFDEIECKVSLPDGRIVPGFVFQSKSLFCNMDRVTISAEGRLIHHRCRFDAVGENQLAKGMTAPLLKRVPLEDVDLDYHGDIAFFGPVNDDTASQYFARFTHGTLEWIRQDDNLSAMHQMLIFKTG
jgi:hypothetical protein